MSANNEFTEMRAILNEIIAEAKTVNSQEVGPLIKEANQLRIRLVSYPRAVLIRLDDSTKEELTNLSRDIEVFISEQQKRLQQAKD